MFVWGNNIFVACIRRERPKYYAPKIDRKSPKPPELSLTIII